VKFFKAFTMTSLGSINENQPGGDDGIKAKVA